MQNRHIYLATKTIQAIEDAVQRDQGAAFRRNLALVLPHIKDIYRPEEERHRLHMGASILGNDCARAVWYNFRWATKSNFSGRMIRLFNRGHMEEARIIACLLTIGCQVYQQDAEGKQFRITHAEGHLGGSGDGIVIGCPDLAAGMPALCEFKTHNLKSFTELKEKGVRDAKFEHYVQSNLYMRKMGLAATLYIGANKNDDELYGELLPLNSEIADRFLDRGTKLIQTEEPPKKLNESPGFWKCRFCDHRPVCHLKAAPDFNCRTCVASEVIPGGWRCRRTGGALDEEAQLRGCQQYEVRKM